MEQSAIQFPMDIANPQNNPLVILLPYDKAVKLSAGKQQNYQQKKIQKEIVTFLFFLQYIQ